MEIRVTQNYPKLPKITQNTQNDIRVTQNTLLLDKPILARPAVICYDKVDLTQNTQNTLLLKYFSYIFYKNKLYKKTRYNGSTTKNV